MRVWGIITQILTMTDKHAKGTRGACLLRFNIIIALVFLYIPTSVTSSRLDRLVVPRYRYIICTADLWHSRQESKER